MQKQCLRCNQSKDTKEFSKNVRKKDGLNIYCRVCIRKDISKPRRTDKTFWTRMIHTMRTNAAMRGQRGRLEASKCSMTAFDLKRQYQTQRGRCYYSGLPMILYSNVSWKASPERLDTDKGYISENVVLVCAEFNGRHQLSVERLKELVERSDMPWVHSPMVFNPKWCLQLTNPRRKRRNHLRKTASGEWRCVKCDQVRRRYEHDGCDNCSSPRELSRRSVRVCEGVKNMYLEQFGRCYISNVPLEKDSRAVLKLIKKEDGENKQVMVHPAFRTGRDSTWSKAKFEHLKRLFSIRSHEYVPGQPIRRRYTRLIQSSFDDSE